jgi:hypothetical protein
MTLENIVNKPGVDFFKREAARQELIKTVR